MSECIFTGGCPKCGGELKMGIALEQTYVAGMPDFPGQTDSIGQTISPGGPGKLIRVIKCGACGASWDTKPVTRGEETEAVVYQPVEGERRYRDYSEWESEGDFMSWLQKADESEFPFWLKDGNSSFRIAWFDRESLIRGIFLAMTWTTKQTDEEE